uniref:Ion transport domain-containing protein n=1 Tax=Biomphalaria glabrata TaxID=6526 RepID=A0A2C9KFB7_BIOGL
MESLLLVSLGKLKYEVLYEVSSVLAPTFILLYTICIVFLLTNFLITIIMDSFAEVREDVHKQPNDYELIDYIVHKLTSFLWQFNPFRLFWSVALALKLVSKTEPKSQGGKSNKKKSDSDLTVCTLRSGGNKKMLTKVQMNFLRTEIGVDRLEDGLDGLQEKEDAIYMLVLQYLYWKIKPKRNDWKRALVQLRVPALIALYPGEEQENASYSIDRDSDFNASAVSSGRWSVSTSEEQSRRPHRYTKHKPRLASLSLVGGRFRSHQQDVRKEVDSPKSINEPRQEDVNSSGYISSVFDFSSPEHQVIYSPVPLVNRSVVSDTGDSSFQTASDVSLLSPRQSAPIFEPKKLSTPISPASVVPNLNQSLPSEFGTASFLAGSDVSLLSPPSLVPSRQKDVKHKRRTFVKGTRLFDDSIEMSMYPSKTEKQRPFKRLGQNQQTV